MSLPSHSPSERLAKLGDVAALVARLSGARVRVAGDPSRIDEAYDTAPTLARARFDDLATSATASASAGIEAVLGCGDVAPAALATLAEAIDIEIARLEVLLAT